MISRDEVLANLGRYNWKAARIGVVASHSSLDTCDGAVSEGFRTLAVCQKGREKTFERYFRAQRAADDRIVRGVVDDTLVLERYDMILESKNQEHLMRTDTLWVPNRSFTSYCSIDAIENDFKVPMVGSRNLLRSEERGGPRDYYCQY